MMAQEGGGVAHARCGPRYWHGTRTPAPAARAGVPATPAGELDEWETKVLEELKSLKSLWENYKQEYLSPAIAQLRALGTSEAIDEAVELERYNEMVRSLFIEAERELDVEISARQCGDEVNMVISAQRVNEALDMLRVYAKGWRQRLLAQRGG